MALNVCHVSITVNYEGRRLLVKRAMDVLGGLPMTIVAGAFLLLDLLPHLMTEFGAQPIRLTFLPFDPAWITIAICGLPLLYLAIWRIIHNPGISKISSALLICIAMFAAIGIGDLFAAGKSLSLWRSEPFWKKKRPRGREKD